MEWRTAKHTAKLMMWAEEVKQVGLSVSRIKAWINENEDNQFSAMVQDDFGGVKLSGSKNTVRACKRWVAQQVRALNESGSFELL